MIQICDGEHEDSIVYEDRYGQRAADPELSVTYRPCDCGAEYDDEKHDRAWPHRLLPPPVGDVRIVLDGIL